MNNVTRSAFFQLRNINRLRRSFIPHTVAILVHSFVTSRIDYCNSLLFVLTQKSLSFNLSRTLSLTLSPEPPSCTTSPLFCRSFTGFQLNIASTSKSFYTHSGPSTTSPLHISLICAATTLLYGFKTWASSTLRRSLPASVANLQDYTPKLFISRINRVTISVYRSLPVLLVFLEDQLNYVCIYCIKLLTRCQGFDDG